jgi:hypothetical protein
MLTRAFLTIAAFGFLATEAAASVPLYFQESARMSAAGLGGYALENEAGKSPLLQPTSAFSDKVQIGASYIDDKLTIKPDEGDDVDVTYAGPQVYGFFPIGGVAGVGVAATALTGKSHDVSDQEIKETYVDLQGGFRMKEVTAGLVLRWHKHGETYESSDEGSPGTHTKFTDEGEDSTTNVRLGVAFRPQPPLRVALAYQPKVVKKYKGSSKVETTNDQTGEVTRTEDDDSPNLIVEDEILAVAGAFELKRVTIMGGLERLVPNHAEYEIDNSSASSEARGATTTSFGVEAQLVRGIVARGNIHHVDSPDYGGNGLGIGADLPIGPVAISPMISYGTFSPDEGTYDLVRLRLQLGVGASL